MASADKFRADFNPPVTLDDDGALVIARSAGPNAIGYPLFQADAMPYLQVRRKGNLPLNPNDIIGSVVPVITHDLLLMLHSPQGVNDPHWELLNPADVASSVDLANARRAILDTVRTTTYADSNIANCVSHVPNGNCLGDPLWAPAVGSLWTSWGWPLTRANPSGWDFVGGIQTRDDPITSVAKVYSGYTLTQTVGGDHYGRTAQNCTVAPLNCYTNCNCDCNCNCCNTCLFWGGF